MYFNVRIERVYKGTNMYTNVGHVLRVRRNWTRDGVT